MPKVLLVSYHFPPSSAVGALRPARLARLLPTFGFEVDVICASGSERRGGVDPSRAALVSKASRVLRIATPFVLGRDPYDPPELERPISLAWWKTRAYFEWLFLTRDWSWQWGQAAGQAARSWLENGEFDLLVLDAPPNPSVIPVIRLAKELGIPSVLDLRDLWWCDDQALPPWWRGSPRLRRTRWESELRDEAVRTADRVVLTSPEMMRVMRGRYPELKASHFSVITNAYGEVDAGFPALEERGSGGRLRLVYTGSLSYGRLEQAIQLIKGMGELREGDGPDIELAFIGDGGDPLRIAAQEAGVPDRVLVEDWMAQDQAIRIQQGADALLLLQPSDRVDTRVAIPAKLFDYMARRRNVLAILGPGPAADIIREFGLGVVVSSESPEDLSGALKELVRRAGEQRVLPNPPEEFSEQRTVASFARILEVVLDGGDLTH